MALPINFIDVQGPKLREFNLARQLWRVLNLLDLSPPSGGWGAAKVFVEWMQNLECDWRNLITFKRVVFFPLPLSLFFLNKAHISSLKVCPPGNAPNAVLKKELKKNAKLSLVYLK